MFDVRMTDNGEEKNCCLCCWKPVSHEALTFMKSHIHTQGHKKNFDIWQKRRQKQKEFAAENITKLKEDSKRPPKMLCVDGAGAICCAIFASCIRGAARKRESPSRFFPTAPYSQPQESL